MDLISLPTEEVFNLIFLNKMLSQIQSFKSIEEFNLSSQTLSQITPIEAFFILGMFPDFLQINPQSEQELLLREASKIRYDAISLWLLSWTLGEKSSVLMQPDKYLYPFNSYVDFELEALLSKRLFELIDAYCDRVNRKMYGGVIVAKPGYLWLMSMAAQCRRSLIQPEYDQSRNSVYEDSKKFRKKWGLNLDSNKEPFWDWYSNISKSVIVEDLEPEPSQHHFDHYLIESFKPLVKFDKDFRVIWKNYWNLHEKFWSRHVKKTKSQPLTLPSKNPGKRRPKKPKC